MLDFHSRNWLDAVVTWGFGRFWKGFGYALPISESPLKIGVFKDRLFAKRSAVPSGHTDFCRSLLGNLSACWLVRSCRQPESSWSGLISLAFLAVMGIGIGLAMPTVWAEEVSAGPRVPAAVPSAKAVRTTASDLQKQLQRELGQAAVSEEENPLVSVLQQMREVEALLAQGQTGVRTQQIQKQILAELDRLIEQAEKTGLAQAKLPAQGKPDAAGAGSPQGPMSAAEPKEIASGAAAQTPSKPPSGPSDEGKPSDIQQLRSLLEEVWGLLPPAQRQQMLETPVEEFLPQYQLLIIDYFRRLAELPAKDKW